MSTVPYSSPVSTASSAGAVASTPTTISPGPPHSRMASMAPSAMSSLLENTTSIPSPNSCSHCSIRAAACPRFQLAASPASFSTATPSSVRALMQYSVRRRLS